MQKWPKSELSNATTSGETNKDLRSNAEHVYIAKLGSRQINPRLQENNFTQHKSLILLYLNVPIDLIKICHFRCNVNISQKCQANGGSINLANF